MDFYVIEDSNSLKGSVTMLKAVPLTVAEVNLYGGVGTENNHVNRYTQTSQGTAYNQKGYGGISYYSAEQCGTNSQYGCTTKYSNSDIKYVVDAWSLDRINNSDLIEDDDGYKVRLIKRNEYLRISSNNTWKYNKNYVYWTMSAVNNISSVYNVFDDGNSYNCYVYYNNYVVRPVVTLKKML